MSLHSSESDLDVRPSLLDRELAFSAELYQLVRDANDPSKDLMGSLGATIAQHTSAIAVLAYDASNPESPVSILFSRIQDIPDNVFSWCVSLSNRALVAGKSFTETSRNEGGPVFRLSASPVVGASGACLLVFHQQDKQEDVERNVEIAAPALANIRQASANVTRQLAALQELITRVEHAETREVAAAKTCESLADYLDAPHVVVAVAGDSEKMRILAVSDQEHLDPESEGSRLALALLQEAVCRRELSVWPSEAGGRPGLLCHRQYAQFLGNPTALGCPLFDGNGRLRGAILVSSPTALRAHVRPFLRSAQQPLATALHLVHRAEQNWMWRKILAMFAPSQRGRRRTILLVIALLAGLLCIPIPYTVKARCRLEPAQERYLAAPFAVKLLRCHVEPGDQVQAGQLLAELDGQETQWELASVQAELQRARKERAGHIARHESGKARLSQYEVEYLESKAQLLNDRIAQLEVRSPAAGIVVSGDLTKAEGVPLEIGQTLFEIAPLESMVAEVAVPEDEVRFVAEGQAARIRLDAFPYQTHETILDSVRPRSETRDDDNVFVADADMENGAKRLRPGMEGTARIRTIIRPIGWIVFHKPVAAIWGWMGL